MDKTRRRFNLRFDADRRRAPESRLQSIQQPHSGQQIGRTIHLWQNNQIKLPSGLLDEIDEIPGEKDAANWIDADCSWLPLPIGM